MEFVDKPMASIKRALIHFQEILPYLERFSFKCLNSNYFEFAHNVGLLCWFLM